MPSAGELRWEPTEERRRLGAALRGLLDVVVRTSASPAELGAVAAAVDDLAARLAGPPVEVDMSVAAGSYREQLSLVGGLSHPVAPQLAMVPTGPESAEGVVVVGPVFQGGPGLVHGGVVALLVDHAMGCVAARPWRPAMTAGLALRYRKPTPLGVPLTVAAALDRVEGRKLHMSATVSAHGQVTVEADAIFLTLTDRNLEAVFGREG